MYPIIHISIADVYLRHISSFLFRHIVLYVVHIGFVFDPLNMQEFPRGTAGGFRESPPLEPSSNQVLSHKRFQAQIVFSGGLVRFCKKTWLLMFLLGGNVRPDFIRLAYSEV